ncbi:protein Tma23p [Monosporozyma servazzii]
MSMAESVGVKDLRRIDSKEYLKSFGWKEGEALKHGGLKKPILVKYKKDTKGLGNAPGGDDAEAWWERLFDGQLKNLDISTGGKKGDGIVFKQNKVVASSVSKQSSPLYQMFVKGEGLQGTIDNKSLKAVETEIISSVIIQDKKKHKKKHKSKDKKDKKSHKRSRDHDDEDRKSKKHKRSRDHDDEGHKSKKHKKSKKEKKHKKEKKENKDKKHKKDKKQKSSKISE